MNEHERRVIFSSKRSVYGTPPELFNPLNDIFKFELDAAASEENSLCPEYYDEYMDSLAQDWDRKSVWCNPPYGKETLSKPGTLSWVRHAYQQVYESKVCGLAVLLIPAKPETKYFQDYCFRGAGILWIRSRLKFVGMEDGAPFPSAVIFFSQLPVYERFKRVAACKLGVLHDFQTGVIYYDQD